MNVDYAKIKLPPLSVLYENARSTPKLQILKGETVTEKLLSKEKELAGVYPYRRKCFLRYSRQCGQQYGCQHPLIYRYVGTEQTSWNVGGSISIPLKKLFDLRGGIKRQRIQVDIAELKKQEAYETLKIQIAHLYVRFYQYRNITKIS